MMKTIDTDNTTEKRVTITVDSDVNQALDIYVQRNKHRNKNDALLALLNAADPKIVQAARKVREIIREAEMETELATELAAE